MSCTWAHKLESEALDRVLSDEERSLFQAHLKTCSGCRCRFRQLVRLQAVLSNAEHLVPSRELEKAVRSIWHPTLRAPAILRLYPYATGPMFWNMRGLRLAGYLAGFLLTAVTFAVILRSFGNFPLADARYAGPGIYTYLTRPSPMEVSYPDASGILAEANVEDINLNTYVSATATRLNDQMLARFAAGETYAVHEDSFSVITSMDSGRRGAIEGVLHSPRDPKLFVRFGQLLSTAQIDLPAAPSNNRGLLVWTFSRIFVTSSE